MDRTKLTSPGLLLIVAVAAAGGLFLLDMFHLQPAVAHHELITLRDQQKRMEQAGRLLLHSEQRSLAQLAEAWSRSPELACALEDGRPIGVVGEASAGKGIEMIARTNAAGEITAAWLQQDGKLSPTTKDLADLQPLLARCAADEGMVKPPSRLMLYGRCDLGQAGRLWLFRAVDEDMVRAIGAAVGGDVVFVASGQLPPSELPDDGRHSVWTSGSDLAMAWAVDDSTGRRVGFFRANVPLAQTKGSSAMMRRTALIVLSLSTGLSLLVITGVHILVTGPVVRLLRRLQRLESGQGTSQDLARDLHGEPLLLARRLESAFDRLAYMSKTDQLTGLANRRHFEQVLECFYNQARRYNRPLSITVMDVDFFKAINDTGGHQAGDEVLKQVARAIEQACRKADLPARFGGDEFAILLPETDAGDAHAVAERIAAAVSGLKLDVRSLGVNVTLSGGVADLNSGELNGPEALLALADRALYAAKDAGRNRIIQAHDLTGMNWRGCGEAGDKVDRMCKKLAGLDNKFKDLFLKAIEEMVAILEQRSPHMADHAYKVQHYALLIAREMELSPRVLKRIQIAAMLHDIGMIAMPDSVLLNSGTLDEQQFSIVRRHPLLSVKIMEGMEFLEQEIPAVRYHHERFDGKGYPEGIAGAVIPLTARILSVADCFDAMTSQRCHRQAKTMEQAIEEIKSEAGTHFDPAVVDALVAAAARLGPQMMDIPPRREPTPQQRAEAAKLSAQVETQLAEA